MQMVGMFVQNLLYYSEYCYNLAYYMDFFIGNSFSHSILLYICSYTFGFCNWHRLIITANLINVLLVNIDKMYKIPISDMELLLLYPTISFIFISIALYNKFVYKNEKCNKNTRK